ncbi:MAG: UxaA family hydrolase [Peptococcaceae bacterium]|jgi:altronate dehydratase large subunit|nr:UxaA family hydrolase [Peptococcaceae bacterium]MDH7525393.1 UxaA family hydrolase [Peptococcaceae bacterium]
MKFMGFMRENGTVGIRNHVAVIPAMGCANEIAAEIARGVKGALPLLHDHACIRIGQDIERAERIIIGLGTNPNVFSVLMAGIGCEKKAAEDLGHEISKSKKPVEVVTIDGTGDFDQTILRGRELLSDMVRKASAVERELCDVASLTMGIKCGGSHAASAIAGNPAAGKAADILTAHGGTVIFSETAEILGAEKVLAKRASSPEVGEKLLKMVSQLEDEIKRSGVDIRGSEPTPGNIQGGLTTLEEKSLGAIVKCGTGPLQGVVDYAVNPAGKGLYLMDGSALTSQLFLGTAAAGAQIQLFIFGGGLPARFRGLPAFPCGLNILPTIKILSSPMEKTELKYFDVYAGDIIEGSSSIEEVGRRLFDEIIAVASGKLVVTEIRGSYSEPLHFYATGLLM